MTNTPTLHPANASSQPAPAKAPSRRVTDAPTRMFHWHWLFALSFCRGLRHGRRRTLAAAARHAGLHHGGGCWAFACCTTRTAHPGSGPAVAQACGAPAWLRALPQASSVTQINWRQSQNPLMALAIVLLLALVVPLTPGLRHVQRLGRCAGWQLDAGRQHA